MTTEGWHPGTDLRRCSGEVAELCHGEEIIIGVPPRVTGRVVRRRTPAREAVHQLPQRLTLQSPTVTGGANRSVNRFAPGDESFVVRIGEMGSRRLSRRASDRESQCEKQDGGFQ